METKSYDLLLDIKRELEYVKDCVTQLNYTEEKRLNSIQEAVMKRIEEKSGEVNDKLTLDISYATERFNTLDMRMFTVQSFIDEIGKKILDVEQLLKEA